MLTREKATDYLETHATPDEDIPAIVAPEPQYTGPASVSLMRFGLAIRVDSNKLGDDESSSGLSTPIINTYDFGPPETYKPDESPICESPKSKYLLTFDRISLLTLGSIQVPKLRIYGHIPRPSSPDLPTRQLTLQETSSVNEPSPSITSSSMAKSKWIQRWLRLSKNTTFGRTLPEPSNDNHSPCPRNTSTSSATFRTFGTRPKARGPSATFVYTWVLSEKT
jgi:hypothetical protein